jgi:hypothetical protein
LKEKQRPLAFHLIQPHHKGMPSDRASLQALKNLLTETDLLISTTEPLPENRTPRTLELLRAALALTDDLLKQTGETAAAIMGHKGGTATAATRGTEYFRHLAGMRKNRAGGRPRKTDQ